MFESRRATRWLRSALVTTSLALSAVTAQALPYSGVVVFGDSLSDTGNIASIYGADPFVATAIGYGSNGRFSNGPVWHEYLSAGLGMAGASSTPSLQGGSNLAFGGARTGAGTTPPGLLTQYALLDGVTPGADPNALYIVWGGGNDLRDVASSGNPAGIPAGIANLQFMLTGLIGQGAKTLLVPNLPNLGLIPEFAGDPAKSALATFASQQWNLALAQMLASLSGQAAIYALDTFGLFNNIAAMPDDFGFTNTAGQCRSVVGGLEVSCVNADEFVFWDAVHPTTAAHEIIGMAAADLLKYGHRVPEPGTLALLLLACIASVFALHRTRRRAEAPQPIGA